MGSAEGVKSRILKSFGYIPVVLEDARLSIFYKDFFNPEVPTEAVILNVVKNDNAKKCHQTKTLYHFMHFPIQIRIFSNDCYMSPLKQIKINVMVLFLENRSPNDRYYFHAVNY